MSSGADEYWKNKKRARQLKPRPYRSPEQEITEKYLISLIKKDRGCTEHQAFNILKSIISPRQ